MTLRISVELEREATGQAASHQQVGSMRIHEKTSFSNPHGPDCAPDGARGAAFNAIRSQGNSKSNSTSNNINNNSNSNNDINTTNSNSTSNNDNNDDDNNDNSTYDSNNSNNDDNDDNSNDIEARVPTGRLRVLAEPDLYAARIAEARYKDNDNKDIRIISAIRI